MEKQADYIKERMSFFAMDIDSFVIGEKIKDIDNTLCEITNKTVNSIEVFIKHKTDQGVDCKQWFSMDKFHKRFKTIK
jgi:hypothetical protein